MLSLLVFCKVTQHSPHVLVLSVLLTSTVTGNYWKKNNEQSFFTYQSNIFSTKYGFFFFLGTKFSVITSFLKIQFLSR